MNLSVNMLSWWFVCPTVRFGAGGQSQARCEEECVVVKVLSVKSVALCCCLDGFCT